MGALALQGPSSRDILQRFAKADLSSLKYFRLVQTTLRDVPVTISRTGYTGDLGFEIWVPAEHAVAVWDALIAAGTPVEIEVTVEHQRLRANAMVSKLPFYDPERKKA